MASSRALILHSWAAFAGLGFVHADSPYNNAHDVNSSVPIYKPLFELPSNSTPRYDDASGLLNPIGKSDIGRRQSGGPNGEGTCAPGSPCVNGACCSKTGICGYSPDFCGAENCISNCDAKAQCGQYAVAGKERCPLNVCCSKYGFCGTTTEFCDDGCDPSGGSCGPPPEPSGGSLGFSRAIGYYESWSSTRKCDAVQPEDLDVTALTHMNFAFAFFHPTTFQVVAMDSNAQSLLTRFTALRSKKRNLKTWISVGGWSFNDPGNNPDTRSAFSNMASSAENRATFIHSLISFMENYGFSGVDLDWEYPVADDRGGKPEDKDNYVRLVADMKAAFGSKYGLSVTLPASYWYLQHFDVLAMEPYIDWFNVMTYDIHGVWDLPNTHTGPYVRPHTNLTEIRGAMELLWRAGVSARNVVLGYAFYGRSFTLVDPACADPWCEFKEGGTPGECTDAAGILSLTEIYRILGGTSTTESGSQPRAVQDVKHDVDAGVKYFSWNGNQWISYDDEDTYYQKSEYATSVGLSGMMAWAVDQGVSGNTNQALTGGNKIRAVAGYSDAEVETVQTEVDADSSCYVTLCGGKCAPGYTSMETMKGRVGLMAGSECDDDELQQLCCLSGTFMGRCYWQGWRGQGLSCFGGSCYTNDILITTNSWAYHKYENGYTEDQMCAGGTMSYCCRGWYPSVSMEQDTALLLLDEEDVETDPTQLSKRDLKTCATAGLISGGTVLAVTSETGPIGALAGLATTGVVTFWCLLSESEAAVKSVSGYSGRLTRTMASNVAAGLAPVIPKPPAPPKGGPKQNTGDRTHYGRYAIIDEDETCSTTYTCEYGWGFDQVCDNQRWGLDEVTNPISVFNYVGGGGAGRRKATWSNVGSRHRDWYRSFGERLVNDAGDQGRYRCELDEFPLDSLLESSGQAMQAVRALNGAENGRQGRDWQDWLLATWYPCSIKLGYAPPVTWVIGMDNLNDNDGRKTAAPNRVIRKYGFDSSSGTAPCYPTWAPAASVNPDHGFRLLIDDPLYVSYHWPTQNYRTDPAQLPAGQRPTSVNSANYLKRGIVEATAVELVPTLEPLVITLEPVLQATGTMTGTGSSDTTIVATTLYTVKSSDPEALRS